MRNCKEFKDIILTDHIDGEISSEGRREVKEHLNVCPDCAAFAADVEKDIGRPFQAIPREEVPDHIWQSIKQSIAEDRLETAKARRFGSTWMELLSWPRLAPVAVGFAVVILAVTTVIQTQTNQAKTQEQIEYLASLWSVDEAESSRAQTAIEEYFL